MTEISVAYYKKLYFGSRYMIFQNIMTFFSLCTYEIQRQKYVLLEGSMDKGILTSDLSISQNDWFQLLFIKKSLFWISSRVFSSDYNIYK